MQKEYPKPYISEHGFYTQTCKCGKNKHEDLLFCQDCIDRKEFGQNFKNITTLESDIARIEQEQGEAEEQKRALKNHKLKLETQIEENTTKIQKIKDKISTLSSSLTNFKLNLTLEKLKIQLHSDVISDDRRIHKGTDDDGYVVLLETHCTIVRVFQSPENVYFGHVTLVITLNNSKEYKWHYGVEIYNKLPENLTHNFWKPAGNAYSHKNNVNSFAYFDHIPEDITLEDMMLSHFNDCLEVFDKQQWSKQIWNDYTPIDEEDPNTLLERLHQEHLKRNNLGFLTRVQKRLQTEAEEKQKQEDIQRRQEQITKTLKKRTSGLAEAIRLELSNTQPKIKKEQRQSRVRPVLTEEEIGKRTEQSRRDREMAKEQPSQQQPRVVKVEPSQQQPRVVKKKDSEEEDEDYGITPSQQQPRVVKVQPSQQSRVVKKKDSEEEEEDEEDGITPNQFESQPQPQPQHQLPKLKMGEFRQIRRFKEIQDYLEKELTNFSDLERELDSMIPISEEASELRDYLIREYDEYLEKINSYLTEVRKNKSRNIQVKLEEDATIYAIARIENLIKDRLKNLRKEEKSYLIEYYRDKDISNEKDDIIIENLLIIQGLEYTRDKAQLYIDKSRDMKEKILGTRNLSTKDVLTALKCFNKVFRIRS